MQCEDTRMNDVSPVRQEPKIEHVGNFSEEGLAIAYIDGRCAHVRRDNTRAYPASYDGVGSFHGGLAWVRLGQLSWHIKPDGTPAYKERYRHVGDFIEAGGDWFAWVIIESSDPAKRAFHIRRDGSPAYAERFGNTGDFAGGKAMAGIFITPDGKRAK
jgi:hypothetical protein